MQLKRGSRGTDRPFALSFNTAKTDIFQRQKVVEAVLRPFTAKSRLLYPSKRSNFCRNRPGIHSDHPVFESFHNLPHFFQVIGVEVGGKAKLSIVGKFYDLIHGLKL